MRIRTLLAVFAMLACAGCNSAGSNQAVQRQQPLYTVTTDLMQKPGELAVACAFAPLPLPPIGCGGPKVADIDLQSISGSERYRNGVVSVGTMRLVGTWDAGMLRLTTPPQPSSQRDRTPIPECTQNPNEPSPTTTPQGERLIGDETILIARGIQVIGFYVCQQALFVVVAVADAPTVDFMTARYAPIRLAGWLRPVT